MGQHPKWHAEQFNRYISDFSKTIHSISSSDNYHSNNHNTSSGIANERSGNIAQNLPANSPSVDASDSLSPLSTTIQLNNRFESLTRRQLHNFSSSFVDRVSDAIQSALTSNQQAANLSSAKLSNNEHAAIVDDDDASIISNYWMLLMIVLYFVVVLGGIFGNASLIVTLFTQSSARLRNPLLVALCLADLMVTGVAAPLTVVALFLDARKTITSTLICKIIHFAQSVPVAASTISLLMLSLDRYATVKHPRLAQLRQRRFLPTFLAFASWISAICVSIPILLENTANYETMVNSTRTNQTMAAQISSGFSRTLLIENNTKSSTLSTSPFAVINGTNGTNETIPETTRSLCQLNFGTFGTMQMPSVFLTIYTLLVFILPGIGVILNHLGVHHKLCALSLTARAAHGELPLPMPIMRRPTHMIIVTGMANADAVREEDDSTNDENNQQKDERRYMMDSTRLKATPRTPRSLRYGHSIRSHAHNTKNAAPSELPLPQTSTLRSRRRLARLLVAGSFVFVFCWSPHVIFLICTKWSGRETYSKTAANYSLLLGYTHSALNPILHWALNQNSLRQSSLLSRLTSVQRYLQAHFHDRNHQPPPSSTNEAALGPFNPRFIKARPQPYNNPPASSHFMY
ncbi:D(2)-like dopamine receptor [Sitodiplosis mosellana]|uniref:D(2)-like dopamine receptor n=1 Tax=Sitodiplosis mosellana TaxID=263140 RepID=UPI00244482A9|nr:D(2)-like dopamine receptor [Sitodiplosis mosellana]